MYLYFNFKHSSFCVFYYIRPTHSRLSSIISYFHVKGQRLGQNTQHVLVSRVIFDFDMFSGESCCGKPKVQPSDQNNGVRKEAELRSALKQGEKINTDYHRTMSMDTSNSEDDEKYYSWKEVALILDRFFMYTFILLVVASTVICLSILASAG